MNNVRHFIDIDDLSAAELHEVLSFSKAANLPQNLVGKNVALIFQKPSTRTRQSSEAAVVQLGGHPVYTRPEEIDLDGRESAEDVAKTLALYNTAVAARVFDHSILTRMASVSNVPIVNLLSDNSHPVQTLADLLTIEQEFGTLENKRIVYVGDANNVAFSLANGAHLAGASFAISHPKGYGFNRDAQARLDDQGIEIESISQPQKAVEGAEVIYTDAWYSMGQEAEKAEREDAFQDFQVNDELMSRANGSAIFMHCLPAHRGSEVTDSVIDGSQSRVWVQAENRMHTMRGLLHFLTR